MIQVENVTKRYGSTTAIDSVSFEVKKGEILGFLGPNGAGKTTTMRVLSGLFPASEGRALVAGYDVFEEPLEAKRRIGYLPETPPLYTEMTVDSYLRFVARIKGVPGSELTSALEYTKERCGLAGEGLRLIKHLSKGFRQRVGLGQALIHNPEVLILDEPTIGLDPNQIIEVRDLIKGLGGDHTVILSTHILPEVSMTCGRVIIINKGKIVAVDTPDNLTGQLSGRQQIEIEVAGQIDRLGALLEGIEGVQKVGEFEAQNGRTRVWIESVAGEEIRHVVARSLIESGFDLFQIRAEGKTLEDVFKELTTKEEAAA
jgi:ABC-2 type transport system ATP-binding protein